MGLPIKEVPQCNVVPLIPRYGGSPVPVVRWTTGTRTTSQEQEPTFPKPPFILTYGVAHLFSILSVQAHLPYLTSGCPFFDT